MTKPRMNANRREFFKPVEFDQFGGVNFNSIEFDGFGFNCGEIAIIGSGDF